MSNKLIFFKNQLKKKSRKFNKITYCILYFLLKTESSANVFLTSLSGYFCTQYIIVDATLAFCSPNFVQVGKDKDRKTSYFTYNITF